MEKTDVTELEKQKRICDTTLKNCIHTKKRLINNDLFSKFILNYYSLFLIVLAITISYFKKDGNLSNYFSIIISIILLIFSIINSNSKYEIRIEKLNDSIYKLKSLKRSEKTSSSFWEKYDEIVDNTEMRTDTDFYYTVKELCAVEGITGLKFLFFFDSCIKDKKLKEYRNSVSVLYHFFRNLILNILKFLLIIFPIIIILYSL